MKTRCFKVFFCFFDEGSQRTEVIEFSKRFFSEVEKKTNIEHESFVFLCL